MYPVNRYIIVMGVSGCGKSTLAKALAEQWNIPFLEGDDFHPQANIDKMRSGHSLDDSDREPWLMLLNEEMQKHTSAILSCSALKKSYRKLLTRSLDDVKFVHLKASFSVIHERLQAREEHFMPASLLKSQYETLQPPKDAIEIDVHQSKEAILKEAIEKLTNGKK